MGRQVGFYWHGSDELEFLSFARTKSPLVLLPSYSPTATLEPLIELPARGSPGWFQVWLWSPPFCSQPVLRQVEGQSCFTIDTTTSEVVQLHRSHDSDGCIVRGRIWAEFSYWKLDTPTPEVLHKSDAFRRWYDSLERWIKKRYTRIGTGEYIAPGAAAYVAEGGRLSQARFSDAVKIIRHGTRR